MLLDNTLHFHSIIYAFHVLYLLQSMNNERVQRVNVRRSEKQRNEDTNDQKVLCIYFFHVVIVILMVNLSIIFITFSILIINSNYDLFYCSYFYYVRSFLSYDLYYLLFVFWLIILSLKCIILLISYSF